MSPEYPESAVSESIFPAVQIPAEKSLGTYGSTTKSLLFQRKHLNNQETPIIVKHKRWRKKEIPGIVRSDRFFRLQSLPYLNGAAINPFCDIVCLQR
jgi:hypothetical protein